MSKSNAFETDLLTLLFNNTNIANIGDATGLRGSSTAGSFYIALHSADPGEAGSTQTTSEVTYGSYARQAVARASGAGGWNISGNAVNNVSAITFPAGTSGAVAQNALYAAVGTIVSGAGYILYRALISNGGLYTGTGITPVLNATTGFVVTED